MSVMSSWYYLLARSLPSPSGHYRHPQREIARDPSCSRKGDRHREYPIWTVVELLVSSFVAHVRRWSHNIVHIRDEGKMEVEGVAEVVVVDDGSGDYDDGGDRDGADFVVD